MRPAVSKERYEGTRAERYSECDLGGEGGGGVEL